MTLTARILKESATARADVLANCDREKALALLAQVKEVEFGTFTGNLYATTEMVASFYEVPVPTVKDALRRRRKEFEGDGVKTLTGQELRDARLEFNLPSKTSQALVWTPKATLRLGLVLDQCPLAETITNLALSALIGEPYAPLPAPHKSASPNAFSPVTTSPPQLVNGRVVCLEADWPRLLCRTVSGIDFYVDSATGTSGLTVEGLAALSGVSSPEITSIAQNLSGKRKKVSDSYKRVRSENVYLLEGKPALVNGKGYPDGVTVYHHKFCVAVLEEAVRKGEALAVVNAFFVSVGGLNAWIQTVTGWGEYTKRHANSDLGISYTPLEAQLFGETLAPGDAEREEEYVELRKRSDSRVNGVIVIRD